MQAKYSKVATAAREIFVEFDPDFESYTLDEAYLDVTDYSQLHSMSGARSARAADPTMSATLTPCSASDWPDMVMCDDLRSSLACSCMLHSALSGKEAAPSWSC